MDNPTAWLNSLAREIFQISHSKGFHDEKVPFAQAIALIHSELSEALEADRKDLMDDKLPHRKGREVELADAVIRIFDCAADNDMDIHGAVMEKMAYNATRPKMHGGKKY